MVTSSLDTRARHIRGILARRPPAGFDDIGLESVEETPAAGAMHPDDVLARVDAVLQGMPADEKGDEENFRKALKTLLESGEPALKKLVQPGATGMTADDVVSLEAIVVTDGSRPSFLLRNGGNFDPNHPFLLDWRADMIAFAPTLKQLAAGVGRVQPANGNASNFIGTGALVDRDNGYVLTNYHVVDDARTRFGVAMEGDSKLLTVTGDLFIDFDGETSTAQQNCFRVKEVRLPEGFGRGFAGLDAVVMRVEPLNQSGGALPAKPIQLSAEADFANGASPTLVTIGFPGEPDTATPPGATIDWTFVIKTLFGNRFGVKRVAPGRFMEGPGAVTGDNFARVLSHDATTFGGASGSLVFAWKDEGAPGFGLHFAGATLSANNAVSLHKAADALRNIGVPIEN
ncbi:trypsin-like serine peptidase [uncultured Bradyrhizobium sp.]|uniref:trypsin-like serine peptidase n=1 Tax=uncultured Bradyrhizobium sp. TaxID=199684 RepID=UPI0035CAA37A